MDLHYSQTASFVFGHMFSLNPLWIYTTLKPKNVGVDVAIV